MTWLPFGPVSGMTVGSLSLTRTFDQRYQVSGIAAGTVMNLTYTHDGAGNVKSISGVTKPPIAPGTTDYTVPSDSNLLSGSIGQTAGTYTYDYAGNIVSDGTRTFTYNQNHRLVQVSAGSSVIAEYAYDGFGRRVKKTVGSGITLFHYDYDGNLISETDGTGNPVRDYIYLNGEPAAMKLYGDQAGIYYFINDHLGTPQKVTDTSGTVVWEAGYMPFGEARVLLADIENNLRFPGQYYDKETGLHYNYHRYYDPETGRYLTPDPIGLEGGLNLYAYVDGNPVNWVDPFGLFVYGVLNTKTQTLTLRDKDTGKKVIVEAFTGGHATPSGIVSPGSGPEKPMPDGGYFITDNPNPKPGHMDWFGLLMDDNRIDDYANELERSGFRLHSGQTSWGCATVNQYQPDSDIKWNQVIDLILKTKSQQIDYTTGPHWWNGTKKIKSYGYIFKR